MGYLSIYKNSTWSLHGAMARPFKNFIFSIHKKIMRLGRVKIRLADSVAIIAV